VTRPVFLGAGSGNNMETTRQTTYESGYPTGGTSERRTTQRTLAGALALQPLRASPS
jgi:hypothetical protein